MSKDNHCACNIESGCNIPMMSMIFKGCICFPRGILCIHPSFRIIGLAEPPIVGGSQQQWLNSELLSMFLFHHVRPLSKQEEAQVIYDMVRNKTKLKMHCPGVSGYGEMVRALASLHCGQV